MVPAAPRAGRLLWRDGRTSDTALLDRIRAQADAGVEHLIVNMPDAWDLRHLERIGREVVPALAA